MKVPRISTPVHGVFEQSVGRQRNALKKSRTLWWLQHPKMWFLSKSYHIEVLLIKCPKTAPNLDILVAKLGCHRIWIKITFFGFGIIIPGEAATCSERFCKMFSESLPGPLGCTAAAMLLQEAWGTFRKDTTKPSEQVASPPGRVMPCSWFLQCIPLPTYGLFKNPVSRQFSQLRLSTAVLPTKIIQRVVNTSLIRLGN